jgi:hypothetical protein
VHCFDGRWFSPGTPFSSTNKTDRHDIPEILLKVTLNTINQNHLYIYKYIYINVFSDKVYQLLAHGQWLSLGTPASSTTNTGRNAIHVAAILLKVALNTKHMACIVF